MGTLFGDFVLEEAPLGAACHIVRRWEPLAQVRPQPSLGEFNEALVQGTEVGDAPLVLSRNEAADDVLAVNHSVQPPAAVIGLECPANSARGQRPIGQPSDDWAEPKRHRLMANLSPGAPRVELVLRRNDGLNAVLQLQDVRIPVA